MRTVSPDQLRRVVGDLFAAAGLPGGDAALAADALVAAELRGVRTHGVTNLAHRYLGWVESGFANPTPSWKVTRGRASLVNVDGDEGLGVVVAAQVMRMAIERAAETGVCMAVIHNSRHVGMAGYHAMLALEAGMIGVCTTAVGPRMVPTFGREPRLGTNPIAFAAPTAEEPPFVFDAATTTVASNKLRLAMEAGEPVAPGLMIAEDGTPVSKPAVPSEPFRLAPLGGTPESGSYKGYGLAAVVDILSSVLSQASFGLHFPTGVAAHCVMAVDVDAALPREDFTRAMDQLVRSLRATTPAADASEVLVAGDPEHRATVGHLRDGIALADSVWEWLTDTAARLGVDASPIES